MSNIRIQLLNVINRDSQDSTNFIIAKYILENLTCIKLVSTKDLAEECNVSKSSISRFCRKIGYEDFMELQIAIATYRSHIDKRFPDLEEINTTEIAQNFLESTKKMVHHFEKQLDIHVLDELVHDLYHYERVVLMGHVQSSFPAFSLQHYLTILHKFVYSTQDLNEQKDMLERFDEHNLIVIFSAGGKFLERVLDRVSVMNREHAPKIYLITATKTTHYPFVYKCISLWDTFDYTSSVALEMYSNLIALTYRSKYAQGKIDSSCFTK